MRLPDLDLWPREAVTQKLVGDLIEVYTTGNVLIPLTTVGSGTHRMVISRTVTSPAATSLDILDHGFATGTALTAISDASLPTPLAPSTTYYLRSIDDDQIELYPSQAQANAVPATTGRITFLSTGTGSHRVVLSQTPVSVKTILAIEKPITEGYIRLYAWDTSATSVRLKYRRRPMNVLTERDFINLDSRMAILMMVQSQELLFKKFIAESEQYRLIAVEYLNKRNRALDGPRAPTFQMNADVTTRPDDWMD